MSFHVFEHELRFAGADEPPAALCFGEWCVSDNIRIKKPEGCKWSKFDRVRLALWELVQQTLKPQSESEITNDIDFFVKPVFLRQTPCAVQWEGGVWWDHLTLFFFSNEPIACRILQSGETGCSNEELWKIWKYDGITEKCRQKVNNRAVLALNRPRLSLPYYL